MTTPNEKQPSPKHTDSMTDLERPELASEEAERVKGGAKATPAPTPQPKDHFLTLDGIDGESQDSAHKGWIE